MNTLVLRLSAIGLVATLIGAACAPEPTPPPVDLMATAVVEAAHTLLTQTAAAASPTPPPPTVTPTPSPTETPTAEPTSSEPIKLPIIIAFCGCWYGPGPAYTLESNISEGKRVELLGIGSVPGWYVIRNPYFHKPCWVEAANLSINSRIDMSVYPVMTPGAP